MQKIAAQKFEQCAFTLIELLVVIAIIAMVAAILFPVFASSREKARQTTCLSNMKQLGSAIQLYIQDYDESYPMNRLPDISHPLMSCQVIPGGFPDAGLEKSTINWKRQIYSYVKNRDIFRCPSNAYFDYQDTMTHVRGDETNLWHPLSEKFPISYAINGAFFHEAVPTCWYGESLARERHMAEIDSPASLILLLESRFPYSDMGSWTITYGTPDEVPNKGPFQSHQGFCNWMFADGHAKALKVARTCSEKLWTDKFTDKMNGCSRVSDISSEE